jgi:hypothetical protein
MGRIRKKLNKSAIILLAILAIGAIVAIVLHFVGIIDLSFVGDWFMGIGMAMSESTWVAGGVFFGLIALGIFIGFWLKDYIVGVDTANATITSNTGNYVAQGQTISQPSQSGTETVVN